MLKIFNLRFRRAFPTISVICLRNVIKYSQKQTSVSQNHFFGMPYDPDALILCINPFGDKGYIKRTIAAAESLTNGKVIATVCYPYDLDEKWTTMIIVKTKVSNEIIQSLKDFLWKKHRINMYMLDKPEDQEKIINTIVSFFS